MEHVYYSREDMLISLILIKILIKLIDLVTSGELIGVLFQ